jgi:hypothetical protein
VGARHLPLPRFGGDADGTRDQALQVGRGLGHPPAEMVELSADRLEERRPRLSVSDQGADPAREDIGVPRRASTVFDLASLVILQEWHGERKAKV